MAVALGSQGTYLAYGGRNTSPLAAPAGIANGDFLIAYIFAGISSVIPTVTAPAGWTALTGSPTTVSDGTGFNGVYHIYYKIASGESGSDYVFTHGALNPSTCGLVIRYTGVDTASPFSPTPTTNTGTGTTATATGFTTTVADAFVIFTEHDWADNTTNTVPPVGTTPTFTERVDQTLIYIADGTLATAGATGDKSHTCNSGAVPANPWAAYLIGLKPLSVAITITLGNKVLDSGLDYISSNANRIYVCSQQPTTYAEATATYDVGYKDFGVGAVAGSPAAATGGRQIVTNAVTAGVVAANGTPTHWAIVDTVNSLLLASGLLSGGVAVTTSDTWALDAFAITSKS